MSHEAVKWAMDDAPMLRTASGNRDATARWVLAAVAERADHLGRNAFPSIADIRYRTGQDRSTVLRALRRLEDAKLIVRDGISKEGCTRWNLSMDMHRPASDREEIDREEAAFRASAAERKRRSRANAVTHSKSVTGEAVTGTEGVTVTGAECVTEPDVTHSEGVTNADVTHSTPGRHALEVCDTADVTHSAPGRHTHRSTRTTLEPPVVLTIPEPPGSENPPPSDFPPSENSDPQQTTLDGQPDPAPQPKPKRGRRRKPKVERTPEQQARFELADRICHQWWDEQCPQLGIPVLSPQRFPAFRKEIEDALVAKCSEAEIKHALLKLGSPWPSKDVLARTVRDLRNLRPTPPGRPTNRHTEPNAGDNLAEAF